MHALLFARPFLCAVYHFDLLPEVINMKLLPVISHVIQQTGNENILPCQVEAAILT